jgi:hypothetical protein
MLEQIVPVSRERHAHSRIRPLPNFLFARGFHLAAVTMQEFVRASAFYPIVFIDDRQQDGFRPVALLGLDGGENLFVNAVAGEWTKGAYIPGILRRYPFALAATPVGDEFAICVDESSGLIGADDGLPLFDEAGAPTETLENVRRFLSEFQQMEVSTALFCSFLSSNNLLRPLSLRVHVAGASRDISGCYAVNEERLDSVSDALFLEMRAKHYLAPLYAHLSSLPQLERLVRLKEAQMSASQPDSAAAASGKVEAESDAGGAGAASAVTPTRPRGRRKATPNHE